jgi:hypothetical protein
MSRMRFTETYILRMPGYTGVAFISTAVFQCVAYGRKYNTLNIRI